VLLARCSRCFGRSGVGAAKVIAQDCSGLLRPLPQMDPTEWFMGRAMIRGPITASTCAGRQPRAGHGVLLAARSYCASLCSRGTVPPRAIYSTQANSRRVIDGPFACCSQVHRI
jgi:hypothetical protein